MGTFARDPVEAPESDPGEVEVEKPLHEPAPSEKRYDRRESRPDIVKRDNQRPKRKVQKRDVINADGFFFSQGDEILNPRTGPKDVRQADDQQVDDDEPLYGTFHESTDIFEGTEFLASWPRPIANDGSPSLFGKRLDLKKQLVQLLL
jgi:hypothetical protein